MATKDDISKSQKELLEKAPLVQEAAENYLKALKAQGTVLNMSKEAVAETVANLTKGVDAVSATAAAMKENYGLYVDAMTVSQQQATQADITLKAYQKLNDLLKENNKLTVTQAEYNAQNLKTVQATAAVPGGPAAPPPPGGPGGGKTPLAGLAAALVGPAKTAAKKLVSKGLGTIASIPGLIVTAARDIDTAAAGFAALTGHIIKTDQASKQFVRRVIEMQHNMSLLGVTRQGVIDMSKELVTGSRTFGTALTRNTPKARELTNELLKLALQAKRVGIDGKDFATTLDIVGKTYRSAKPVEETRKLSAMFVNLARATGQTVTQVSKNFGTAMESLSAYSLPKATEMFKKLQITAADTGVSIGTLLKTAGKFDTFGDAANAVGDLNAMLGGPYLNTLDMVNATEEERVAMLTESMAATGKTFDQMDRFEKKAIAQAIGTTVKEARGLFAGEGAPEAKPGASWDDMMGGAEKNAVALNDQIKAVSESLLLTGDSFKVVDEGFRELVGMGSTIAPKVRDLFSGAFVAVFQTFVNRAMNAVNKALRSKDFIGAFREITIGLAGDIAVQFRERLKSGPQRGPGGVPVETPFPGAAPGPGGGARMPIQMKGNISAPIIIQFGTKKLVEEIREIAFAAVDEYIEGATAGTTVGAAAGGFLT